MDELFLNTSLDTLVETNAVEIRKFSSLINSSRGVSLVITCIREEDEDEEEEEEEEEEEGASLLFLFAVALPASSFSFSLLSSFSTSAGVMAIKSV